MYDHIKTLDQLIDYINHIKNDDEAYEFLWSMLLIYVITSILGISIIMLVFYVPNTVVLLFACGAIYILSQFAATAWHLYRLAKIRYEFLTK